MVFGDAGGLEDDEAGMRDLEQRVGRTMASIALNHAERILWPRRAALLALACELDARGTMTGEEVEAGRERLDMYRQGWGGHPPVRPPPPPNPGGVVHLLRGVERWQLARLITSRRRVRFPPPQLGSGLAPARRSGS